VNYLCKSLPKANRTSIGEVAWANELANERMLGGRKRVWRRLLALGACPPGRIVRHSCVPTLQKKGTSSGSCVGGEGRS
jgi:hypothetical protein